MPQLPIHINSEYSSQSDVELLLLFKDKVNEQAVFYEIVRRYKQKIYFHVRGILIFHEDADDAAQSTFIKVWENLASFRGDSALFSWIYRIATNEALRILKSKKANISMEDLTDEIGALIDNSPYFDGNDIQKRLQKELLKLPEKQRLVFNMKYFDDLTYDRISEITGTSVGALKASYFHAVKKLENLLLLPN